MTDVRLCSVDGCDKPVKSVGLCNPHYRRKLRHGDPLAGGIPKGEARRFLEEAVLNHSADKCLLWPYGKTPAGYGVLMLRNTYTYVHHHVCEAVHGARPLGMEAAHSCGNSSCCSPRHLRWASPSENNLDKRQHGTHNHGEQNPNCILTDADVEFIRSSPLRNCELADRFGVAPSRISQIRSGQARVRKTGDFS